MRILRTPQFPSKSEKKKHVWKLKLVFILRKNLFPVHLIDKCVHRYLNTAIDRYGSTRTPPSSNYTSQGKQYFYKLPYLGRISTVAQS